MNPNHPLTKALQSLNQNDFLDPKYNFQQILEIPPFICKGKNCKNQIGFRISVGCRKNLNVSIDLLERVYDEIISHRNKIFDQNVFQSKFYDLYKTNPSYFHIIGKIITKVGLGKRISVDKYLFF
ncbi:hypothetical protein [Algoriphagus vanfongensis]|uniref:hypothetical protein n=1 Tax=Algoriphagus vanfongensis TaxID=426371 RepID=UPI00047D1C3A|nr:hypothetical protein [Algoriphagus vanfongensis]